jgi:aminoglycoside phosphotransferase (APT) family kinase protein
MTAFEIQLPGGETRRYILRQPAEAALRQNPRAAQDEFELLRILRSQGLPVPSPQSFQPAGEIISTPCLVIEYVAGEMDFSPANQEDTLHQMAALLARIHSADCARLDLSFLPPPPAGFSDTFGESPVRMDASFDVDRLRATLQAAWPLAQRNPPALLHGDYWPGNLLWREGQLAAVIDWEDARLGDPLSDLAISRLDICWIFGIQAMHSFTRHYQSLSALDYTNLPYWDLAAALRLSRLAGPDLAGWAAYFYPYGREDISAASIREHYRFFIDQAFTEIPKYSSFP